MAHEMPAHKARYENFIGGEWVAPAEGKYFEDRSPVDGRLIAEFPRSTAADIDRAVAAAWKAAPGWGAMSPSPASCRRTGWNRPCLPCAASARWPI